MVCLAIRRTFVLICSLLSFSTASRLSVSSGDPLYVRVPWVTASKVETVFEGARGALVFLVGKLKRVTSGEIPWAIVSM